MPAETSLVLGALRDSGISVSIRGSTLDFNPEPPDALKPLLIQEGTRLLGLHREAAMALTRIVDDRSGNAKKWLTLRNKIGKHENYRDDIPEYRLLASWIAAHEMSASAYQRLRIRRRSTFNERASWKADIAVSDRLAEWLRPRLLGAALLNPELHAIIVNIR
jgi:hypothetical protein